MTSKFYIFKIKISHEIVFSIFQQGYLTKNWDAQKVGGGGNSALRKKMKEVN